MDRLIISAFLDEMERIASPSPEDMASELRKEASASMVARTMLGTLKGSSKVKGRQLVENLKGVKKNLKKTVEGFSTPVKSVKQGWEAAKKDFKGEGDSAGKKFVNRAFLVAPAAADASDAVSKEDPEGKGRSRAKRIRGAIGNQLGGLVGYKHGITGNIVGGYIGKKVMGG
jgi:hypothetical protein